ncbi:ATP-binding protein [uncultured Acetatifactor sp.]|uniref:ATP-binding protein n=1 Tax=uncultured Acetatifactor sp. TaxID=1671927 RepID=UPI0026190C39|nr:ATP-binding protein [uncultured Acetatifactor sp.]
MYIQRHMEETVEKLSKMFGAVLVSGPRQVGKTTMLQGMTEDAEYVTLDDPLLLTSAIETGTTFFKDNPPPIFLDEVQKAPNLFPQIKLLLDKDRKKGQFFLCGSQSFQMMKNVSESLAGRLGIAMLQGLSMREKYGCRFREAFVPTEAYLAARREELKDIVYADIWENIHRGSMPELYANPDFDWQMFYGAYVRTYIERDVRELTQVGDEVKFTKFMAVMAARTGQLLNLSAVASDVGISQPTADRWLSILTASNIVYLLQPYSNNLAKRAVKTPKLYFLDTGLAAYLTKWNGVEVLKNGAMAGAFFESFVVSEVLKSYYNQGVLDPPLYFYRDKDQREIDLLVAEGDVLYPLEIKKHADPKVNDITAFDVLEKLLGVRRGSGGVICTYDRMVTLKGQDRVIPVGYL